MRTDFLATDTHWIHYLHFSGPNVIKTCLQTSLALSFCAASAAAIAQPAAQAAAGAGIEQSTALLQAAVECKHSLARNAVTKPAIDAAAASGGTIAGPFTVFGLKASKIHVFMGTDGDGESYSATFETATMKDITKAAKLNKDGRRELKGKHLEIGNAEGKPQLTCVIYN